MPSSCNGPGCSPSCARRCCGRRPTGRSSARSRAFSVAADEATDPYRFDYNPAPRSIGAPGIDIEVPRLGGSTIKATGNSFAARHIAGLIARILGKHPGLTPFQVKTILLAPASNASGRRGRSKSTDNPEGDPWAEDAT